MGSNTWTQVAAGSGIVAALGGGLAALGEATGSEFLSDLGPIAASIGGVGVAVAGAGAFATADRDQQSAALVAARPSGAAITAQGVQQQAVQKQAAGSLAQVASNVGVPVVTRQEAAVGGFMDAIGAVIAIPIKLVRKLIGQA